MKRTTSWKCVAVLALLPTLAAVGCAGGKGTVEGHLTVAGKPVTTGALITFIGTNGEKAQAVVEPDGSFLAENAPAGVVAVTVENAPLLPPAEPFKDSRGKRMPPYKMGEKPPPHKPAVLGDQVPVRYRNLDNGLTYTIHRDDDNEINIDLMP